jgi:hypothetical protein
VLKLKPITLREANAYIVMHHRHHGATRGCKFAIGATVDDELVGVAVVGRPVSRMLDDGYHAEVTRNCTNGTRNACSFLYGACWRAARSMGYRKIITYILESETGDSLIAAGWVDEGPAGGDTWDRPGRRRVDKAPLDRKHRWSKSVNP